MKIPKSFVPRVRIELTTFRFPWCVQIMRLTRCLLRYRGRWGNEEWEKQYKSDQTGVTSGCKFWSRSTRTYFDKNTIHNYKTMARSIHLINCDFTRTLFSFFVFSSAFFTLPLIHSHDSNFFPNLSFYFLFPVGINIDKLWTCTFATPVQFSSFSCCQ